MKETAGVTSTDTGLEGAVWNVVGQIYTPKLHSDNALIWHAVVPADTFVPPHVHPTQDEWILVTEGNLEVDFGFEDGNVTPNKAGPGDLIRMPMGVAHSTLVRPTTRHSWKSRNTQNVASFLSRSGWRIVLAGCCGRYGFR